MPALPPTLLAQGDACVSVGNARMHKFVRARGVLRRVMHAGLQREEAEPSCQLHA